MQSAPSRPFDTAMGMTLKSLLDQHGLPLLGQADTLRQLLSTYHPDAQREATVLLQALQQGLPQALLLPAGNEAPHGRAARLAHELAHATAMAPAAAQWAVHAWQTGLGLLGTAVMAAPMPPAAVQVVAPATAWQAMPVTPVTSSAPGRRTSPKLLAGAGVGVAVLACAGLWFALGQTRLEITGVRAAQSHLVGDGKPQPVTLSFTAKNAEIKAIESRFVSGDGNWTPRQQTMQVDAAAAKAGGDLNAGVLVQRASAPMSATFEYTLVAKDGKRSEPYTHTFNVVPPVVITGARLATPPRLNQAYSVQLAYKKGAGDIVQVTRRVVDSSVPWAQPEQTMPVNINQASGTFDFAMDAPTQPMRSTIEFEMVDSMGIKSDPVRVAVNVNVPPMTQGPATVLSVVLISGGGAANGVGAVGGAALGTAIGNQIGRGSGRTAATVLGLVGGGIAGHMVEQKVRGPSVWETTVRFDDGNTRRIRHADQPGWAAGQRVMVTGGGIAR